MSANRPYDDELPGRGYPSRHDPDTGDHEISLGTPTILGIFFALALVCAAFFGFGYTLGRRSAPAPVVTTDPPEQLGRAKTCSRKRRCASHPFGAAVGGARPNCGCLPYSGLHSCRHSRCQPATNPIPSARHCTPTCNGQPAICGFLRCPGRGRLQPGRGRHSALIAREEGLHGGSSP